MATAEKKLIPVPPVVQKYNIVLTLDQNEAETLLAITGKIGGEPERTRRRFVDSIRRALILAGVNTVDTKFMLSLMNGVWFSTEGVV